MKKNLVDPKVVSDFYSCTILFFELIVRLSVSSSASDMPKDRIFQGEPFEQSDPILNQKSFGDDLSHLFIGMNQSLSVQTVHASIRCVQQEMRFLPHGITKIAHRSAISRLVLAISNN